MKYLALLYRPGFSHTPYNHNGTNDPDSFIPKSPKYIHLSRRHSAYFVQLPQTLGEDLREWTIPLSDKLLN